MDHSPLQQRLADHLKNRPAPIGVQEVFVGTKLVDDGWVIAFFRIDGCTSEHQAAWFGTCVQDDLLTHLRDANQEDVPAEAVQVEWAVSATASPMNLARSNVNAYTMSLLDRRRRFRDQVVSAWPEVAAPTVPRRRR